MTYFVVHSLTGTPVAEACSQREAEAVVDYLTHRDLDVYHIPEPTPVVVR